MFIVTGGAGFVGSNLVRELNRRGHTDILVVDNLARCEKARNLSDLNRPVFLGQMVECIHAAAPAPRRS